MKLRLYVDVYPWTRPEEYVVASTRPCEKILGTTRYAIDVEIPDPRKPDVIVTGAAVEVAEPA